MLNIVVCSKLPSTGSNDASQNSQPRLKFSRVEASAIRDRIMNEMLLLEEERMERMAESEGDVVLRNSTASGSIQSVEDEKIIRQELNKVDPSALVFSESWSSKKAGQIVRFAKLPLTPSEEPDTA